jgi:hypothetical protein
LNIYPTRYILSCNREGLHLALLSLSFFSLFVSVVNERSSQFVSVMTVFTAIRLDYITQQVKWSVFRYFTCICNLRQKNETIQRNFSVRKVENKLSLCCIPFILVGIEDSEVSFIHFHCSIVYSMHTIVLAYECDAETGFVWFFTI